MGMASYLLCALEEIAIENGYQYFKATVLRENEAMIHVFKKRYPNAKIGTEGGEISILMDFKDAVRTAPATMGPAQGKSIPSRKT